MSKKVTCHSSEGKIKAPSGFPEARSKNTDLGYICISNYHFPFLKTEKHELAQQH